MTAQQTWQEKAAAYRAAALDKIPKEWRLPTSITNSVSETSDQCVLDIPRTCGLLTAEELDITENYDAVALAELLAKGKFTSVAVTTAFCKRAAIAQQLANCLTETFFDIALERAKFCDDYLNKQGKTLGHFHGLPISVKETFSVKGVRTTIGFVSFATNPVKDFNSALIEILLAQGAVLYVKTNVPQTMMTADSDNNLFGRVRNPHRLLLTAGGSSGGEGALLAMKGSVIGVGTDIAGSVRIPAYVNGTIGFRPTARRVPYFGQTAAGRPGSWGILPSVGPLTRTVRDVEFFFSTVLGAQNDIWSLDEAVVYAPWRKVSPSISETEGEKLCIGVLTESPKYPLHPSVFRTFNEAVSKLKAAGHTIVDMHKTLPADIIDSASMTAWSNFNMDSTKHALSQCKVTGEPVIPSIPISSPPELKYFQPTIDDVFRVNVEMRAIGSLLKNAWVKEGLDVLVMPVYQGTAVGHDQYGVLGYTVLQNLVDYPTVSIPYGQANAELDAPFRRDVSYIPPYVPIEVEGAPSGFQIMGRTGRDEELVVSTKIIEDAIRA
ncbi:hypothetical protein V502_05153 [Pseudogymnoascus sp. VKM F-4520 (FW-2644)]|nr:hypothetical protein V502_05153 [Pseudogymnoascus sp. VKM F-4520 (FW-2644)]